MVLGLLGGCLLSLSSKNQDTPKLFHLGEALPEQQNFPEWQQGGEVSQSCSRSIPLPFSTPPESRQKGRKKSNICHAIIRKFSINCRNCYSSSLNIHVKYCFPEEPSSPHLGITSLPCQQMYHHFSSRELVTGMIVQLARKHQGKQHSCPWAYHEPWLTTGNQAPSYRLSLLCLWQVKYTTATPNRRLFCTVQRVGSFQSNHYHCWCNLL